MIFPVTGLVERENGDTVPVLKIDMMSDERWQQLAAERAVKRFREWYGREPESLQEAQREYIAKFLHKEDGHGRKDAS